MLRMRSPTSPLTLHVVVVSVGILDHVPFSLLVLLVLILELDRHANLPATTGAYGERGQR